MKTICHITVLNPAEHARIYHRLAYTQHELGYQVHIIGQGVGESQAPEGGIFIHHMGIFGRLSFKRLLYSWQILPLLRSIKADQYWLHSPELLPLGRRLARKQGVQVLYDMHEDYPANILAATYYPALLRSPLARWVRRIEKRAIRWLAGVSYAELSYDNVLGLSPDKRMILRNTFAPHLAQFDLPPHTSAPYVLITGTLAEAWGVFESINVWEQLCQSRPIKLIVAGYQPHPRLLQALTRRLSHSPFSTWVELIGGDQYVPYERILSLIKHCYLGLGLYHPLPHLRDKIPTKFYEFMAMNKPLLITDSPTWTAFNRTHRLGLAIKQEVWQAEASALIGHQLYMEVEQWYAQHTPHPAAYYSWQQDAAVLTSFMKKLDHEGSQGQP